jgi:hypothetical protein
MNMRTLTLLILSLVAAVSLLIMPLTAEAAFDPFHAACNNTTDGAVCSTKTNGDPLTGTNGLIVKVTRVIALFASVSAVIIIIVGGLMYVLSGGDSSKVSRAKDTIIYAAVGLVVIALSQSIIVFIIDRL